MEIPQLISKNFPGGSDGKESACNAGDLDLSRVEKMPWGREWMPTPVFLPVGIYLCICFNLNQDTLLRS